MPPENGLAASLSLRVYCRSSRLSATRNRSNRASHRLTCWESQPPVALDITPFTHAAQHCSKKICLNPLHHTGAAAKCQSGFHDVFILPSHKLNHVAVGQGTPEPLPEKQRGLAFRTARCSH